MDILERNELIQDNIQTAQIKSIQKSASSIKLMGNGYCLTCKSRVKPVKTTDGDVIGRWCSPECRDDWQDMHD